MSWNPKSFFWEFSGIFIKSQTRDKFFLLITIHVFEQTRKHFVCSRTFQWMLEVMQMGPHRHTMCNQTIGQPWFINILMFSTLSTGKGKSKICSTNTNNKYHFKLQSRYFMLYNSTKIKTLSIESAITSLHNKFK